MPNSSLIVRSPDMTPPGRAPVRSHRRRSGMFHPRDFLDWVFEVGIVLKCLNGLLELVGGVLLLIVSPAAIKGVVRTLTEGELYEDPHDLIASRLLHAAGGLTGGRPHLRRGLSATPRRGESDASNRVAAQQAVGVPVDDRHAARVHRLPGVSDCSRPKSGFDCTDDLRRPHRGPHLARIPKATRHSLGR